MALKPPGGSWVIEKGQFLHRGAGQSAQESQKLHDSPAAVGRKTSASGGGSTWTAGAALLPRPPSRGGAGGLQATGWRRRAAGARRGQMSTS